MTSKKQFTNKYQNDVALFHETAGHPIEYTPTVISQERSINRTIWTAEELVEYLHASCSNIEEFNEAYLTLLAGMNKAYAKSESQEFPKTEKERIVAQSDALGDANYFINGTFDEMGVDGEKIHNEIQKANMSKFYQKEDGTYYAKFREDGKILKAPSFTPPEEGIKAEIERQMSNITLVENLMFSFEYSEFMDRLGFDPMTDQLVNAGLDRDKDIEVLVYGQIVDTDDLPISYGLKTGYLDAIEVLHLLEEDHESINLNEEEYEYELVYVGTELSKQQVVVRVIKTYISEDID